MAEVIPTLQRTWEFGTNMRYHLTTTSPETAGWQMSLYFKNCLLGQVYHGYNGAITEISAGTTYGLDVSTATVGGYTLGGITTLSGSWIEITGATTGANNGVFEVTGISGGDTVIEYANPAGQAEAFTGDFRVSANENHVGKVGQFTAGPGGKFPAWRCGGSGAGSTGKGAAMDGRDRWSDSGDLQSSTSTAGNRSWFVFENEITGAQIMLEHRTNTTSNDFHRSTITVAPEGGFTGGAANAVPTSAIGDIIVNDRTEWMGSSAPDDDEVWWFNMMHTTDGEYTYFFGGSWNEVKFWVISVTAVGVEDSLVPWNGGRNLVEWVKSTDVDACQLGFMNDGTNIYGIIDKDGTAGGPYQAGFYMTTTFLSTATVPEYINLWPSRLDGEDVFLFYPVGLATDTTGVKGRHGYLDDIWYIHNTGSQAMRRTGITFPSDGSRQFVQIYNFLFPWDGVTDMRIR